MATTAFLAAWRRYDADRQVLVKVNLTSPSARTLYLATGPVHTPDGQFWQPLILELDPIDAPGQFLSSGFDACQAGFRLANGRFGFQTLAQDVTDAFSAYTWIGAQAIIYLWSGKLTSFADALAQYFVVEDYQVDQTGVHVDLLQRGDTNRAVVPRYVDRRTEPRAPDKVLGAAYPIIIGDGRSRGLRGDWNGSNHTADQQRFALNGGLIPASPMILVDQGAGGGGSNPKAKAIAAGHRLTSLIEAGNLGNAALKTGSDLSLFDVPSADVFTLDDGSGFYIDDANAFGYAFIPFVDTEAQTNQGDNARHLLDRNNEYGTVRLDYDASKRNTKYNLASVPNLGTIVDVRVVAGYKTSGAGDVGQEIEFKNNAAGSTFLNNAAGLPGSTTPATTSFSIGAPGVGNSLSTALAAIWDFSGIDVFLHFKAGVWTGAVVDFYWAGVVVKFIPKQSLQRVQREYRELRQGDFAPLDPAIQKAPALFAGNKFWISTAIMAFDGELYAQPQGWRDSAPSDGITLATTLAANMDATYAGFIGGGYGFHVRAGWNDALRYSVTGAPSNPYTGIIASGKYQNATAFLTAVLAALNASTASHGKTFTGSYDVNTHKFTISCGAGTWQPDFTYYTNPAWHIMGYQMGTSPAAALSFTSSFARQHQRFYLTASGVNVTWKWADALTTCEVIMGFDPVNDGAGADTRGDRAVVEPIYLDTTNNSFRWNDGADHTDTITIFRSYMPSSPPAGTALVEEAPSIAALILNIYGGQDFAVLNLSGGYGSMDNARAFLQTWKNTPMIYHRAILEATDTHTLLIDLAKQSASWFMLDRFTDLPCWLPWQLDPAVSYAYTIRPDDVVSKGFLDVRTTGRASVVTAVRVPHLYDASKRQMISDAFVSPEGSKAGYDFVDIRDEYLSVVAGLNDNLDFDGTGVNAVANLEPGDYTPTSLRLELANKMAFADGAGFQVDYFPLVVLSGNDRLRFDVGGANLDAILTPGQYASAEALAAELQTRMVALAAGITVTWSRSSRKFTISKSSGTLNLRWNNASTTCQNLLGYNPTADDTGSLSYVADYEREELRWCLMRTSAGTFKLKWETGPNGLTGTKANVADLIGFLGLRDQTGGQQYMGACPKTAREQACIAARDAYGGRKEVMVNGSWIRDSATARELRNRLADLGSRPRIEVRFASTRVPDLKRGQVIQFDIGFDTYLGFPKAGSDGSWSGKKFYVVEIRQHLGDGGRWDTEVTAVEAGP